MELLFDILFEGFLWALMERISAFFCAIALSFVPVKKRTKKAENIVKLIGFFVGIAMLVMWLFGVILFFVEDAKSILSWIFLIITNLYIIVGLIYSAKKNPPKSNKNKK